MADNLIRLQNIVGKQLELILIKLSQKLISKRIRADSLDVELVMAMKMNLKWKLKIWRKSLLFSRSKLY
jgi:hypothetical protein